MKQCKEKFPDEEVIWIDFVGYYSYCEWYITKKENKFRLYRYFQTEYMVEPLHLVEECQTIKEIVITIAMDTYSNCSLIDELKSRAELSRLAKNEVAEIFAITEAIN